MSKKCFMLVIAIAGLMVLACQRSGQNVSADDVRDFANALYNRELFKQSIAEYERYLNNYKLSKKEQANVSLLIGNIYFERLKDYENAMAYYLRIKQLYHDTEIEDEANKRIVECLERLQRSTDAQQALEEATFLNPSQAEQKRPGEVVAVIGKQEITTGDLDYEMKRLPPYMLEQIKDHSQKVEFLKQYIATELLYNAARRKGLDRDPEVTEVAFQAKKHKMVEKLLQEELSQNIDFQEDDLRTYYRANISKYTTAADSTSAPRQKSFEEVRDQVTQDYIRAKQSGAYNRLIDRMMRAEGVTIFEDKIK